MPDTFTVEDLIRQKNERILIANLLQKARREKGYTQEVLAERAEIHPSTIDMIENPARNWEYIPRESTLIMLENALDAPNLLTGVRTVKIVRDNRKREVYPRNIITERDLTIEKLVKSGYSYRRIARKCGISHTRAWQIMKELEIKRGSCQ